MVSGICIRTIQDLHVCVCVCMVTAEEIRLAINCQSLKLGKTVCMGPDILFSYECLKLSIKKKNSMYKKYCGLNAQKMPLGGLRVCVA